MYINCIYFVIDIQIYIMKFIISGCNGKMGQVLCKNITKNSNYSIVCGIDRNPNKILNTFVDDSLKIYTSFNDIPKGLNADVIIDFSHPSVLDSILEYCKKSQTPAVLCTTGYTDSQLDKIRKYSNFFPIFCSRNMSLCVNLMVELAKKAFRTLGLNYDVEIVEKHHNQKIDSPSGTALMLAEAISKLSDNKMEFVFDRHSKKQRRNSNEIGIHSIRGGTINGEHDIIFAGQDEILTISHNALSRDIFALGAIKAGIFLKDKHSGMYNMQSILNF